MYTAGIQNYEWYYKESTTSVVSYTCLASVILLRWVKGSGQFVTLPKQQPFADYTIANGVLPLVQEAKHRHLYVATSRYYLLHSRELPFNHGTTSGRSHGLTLVAGTQAQCCYAPRSAQPSRIQSGTFMTKLSSTQRHTLQWLTIQKTLHAIRCMLLAK